MIISVSTGLYYCIAFTEILDLIKASGCTNIELFINQSIIDIPILNLAEEIVKRNLKVRTIHTPIPVIIDPRNETERIWILRSIEYAKVLGASLIVTHCTHKQQGQGYISLDYEHKDNLSYFSSVKDIILTTENNSFLPARSFTQYPYELLSFLRNKNINLTFDTTHWVYTGRGLLYGYDLFKNYIRNIHISDNRGGEEHVALGEGTLPLRDFIRQLERDKYNSYLTIELDFENSNRNIISSKEMAIEKLKNSLNYISSCL